MPGGLIKAVRLSFMRHGKLSMLFMVPAAVKAKRLNSCPDGANCNSAWHNELRTTFRGIFLSAQMSHAGPHSRTNCAQSNSQ